MHNQPGDPNRHVSSFPHPILFRLLYRSDPPYFFQRPLIFARSLQFFVRPSLLFPDKKDRGKNKKGHTKNSEGRKGMGLEKEPTS